MPPVIKQFYSFKYLNLSIVNTCHMPYDAQLHCRRLHEHVKMDSKHYWM